MGLLETSLEVRKPAKNKNFHMDLVKREDFDYRKLKKGHSRAIKMPFMQASERKHTTFIPRV